MIINTLAVPGQWLVHAYYTVVPYAPDSSGRILAAGGNLEHNSGEVLILSADGEVLDRSAMVLTPTCSSLQSRRCATSATAARDSR